MEKVGIASLEVDDGGRIVEARAETGSKCARRSNVPACSSVGDERAIADIASVGCRNRPGSRSPGPMNEVGGERFLGEHSSERSQAHVHELLRDDTALVCHST